MTLSMEIRNAMKARDYDAAQAICDEMKGAQAHNWQRKIDKARDGRPSNEER